MAASRCTDERMPMSNQNTTTAETASAITMAASEI
jgi:hypothetical protein